MPLVGLIDPSHNERAADEPGRLPRWLSIDEVLETAAMADPKWSPWPFEMLNAAIQQWQERDYISTTMLTGPCPRSQVIARHADFVESVDNLYAALRGTQVHRTLEHAVRPGAVAEARFFTTLYVAGHGDVEVSCSPDLLVPDTVWDYKVTENPPTFDYPYKSHTAQLNINRYIVNHAEKWVDVDGQPFDMPFDPRNARIGHLAIVYLGPKGPKVIETTKSQEVTTPNGKTIKRKLPYVWSDDEVMEYLQPRLDAMVRALDSYPEWPTGVEDVWGGQPGWDCPGPPICRLPNCLAKRYGLLIWENE